MALIDRLSVSDEEERRRELLPLLEAIISAHHDNSLFRLMKPAVLEFVFKLVKKAKESGNYPHDYFEAAREVRYSAQNEELLRRNFNDLDASARELAAELTGIYGLAKYVQHLVRLLKDEDENVQSAVFKSCGRIGVPAIEPLLETLDNANADAELKRLIIVALINVGHLNKQISESLSKQFEKELSSNDDESLERLLLAAAHLRDRRQVEYVLQSLDHKNEKIIWYAAKFFTEAPDKKAFEPLRKILGEIVFPHPPDVYGRWYYEQVIAALVRINRARIAPELKTLFEQSLENYEKNPDGKHLFTPSRIAELADKHDLADCYPMIFKYLVKIIEKNPASAAVFHLTEELEKVWNPESMEKMFQAGREMETDGADVARLFVEAVLPYIEDDQDIYGDRLNRISHLHPAIKGSAANFMAEAGRLLTKTHRSSTKELSTYFWILADESAESYLLSKFDELIAKNRAAEEERISRSVSNVARALSTCGGSEAAKRILSFLAEDARGVTINFPAQTLLPLLIRKVIAPSALAELATDEKNKWVGRAVSVEALARYDAPGHLELFQNLAENADGNNTLLRDAVIALGVTRSPLAARPLREVLRKAAVPAEIKGYAARASNSPWKGTSGRIRASMTVKGIFEFAPTDKFVASPYLDANNTAWTVVLPACDGDVINLNGVKPFDRMLKASSETVASSKSTYFVYGANHNFYNAQWQRSEARAACIGPNNTSLFGSPTVTGTGFGSINQQKTGLASFLAFFRANVGGSVNSSLNQNFNPIYGLPAAVSSITKIDRGYTASPSTSITKKFNDLSLAISALDMDICATTSIICSSNSPTTLQGFGKRIQLGQFNNLPSGMFTAVDHDEDLVAPSVSWYSPAPNRYFQTTFIGGASVNATTYQALDFRVSRRRSDTITTPLIQNSLNPSNPTNFLIQLVMNDGRLSMPVAIRKYISLEGPVGTGNNTGEQPWGELHPILRTVKVPLVDFAGADLTQVKAVRFVFSDTGSGAIFLNDIRLSK